MTVDDVSAQRSRLYWQCRRGMLELDILLQAFYTAHSETLNDQDVIVFTELLACSDEQLHGYLMGRVVPSDSKLSAMIQKIRQPSMLLSST